MGHLKKGKLSLQVDFTHCSKNEPLMQTVPAIFCALPFPPHPTQQKKILDVLLLHKSFYLSPKMPPICYVVMQPSLNPSARQTGVSTATSPGNSYPAVNHPSRHEVSWLKFQPWHQSGIVAKPLSQQPAWPVGTAICRSASLSLSPSPHDR